jgi:DNA helicase-2/ATP-dependent DNA helicase PcrA
LSFHHALLDEYGEAEGTERWANVEELRNVAQEYTWMPQESQLTTFLEEVTLMGDIDRLDTRADAITCITLHQSKGLEFPVVFLIGVEDGLLPHSGAMKERDKDKLKEKLAEERRLFYVGITRAQERLYLLHCFRRFSYGGEAEVRPPSRFLSRIPPELMRKRSNREHKSSRTQQEMFSARSSFHSAPQREITAQEDIRTKSDASPTSSEKRKKATTRSRSKRTHVPGVRFVPGMRVHHALYGKGTVVTSTLVEGDEEVTVHFDEEDSERRLLASFAQLEKAS